MEDGRVRIASRGFFAWFLVAVFYALQYVFRVMPNTFPGMIMEKFGVGAFAFGQFSALYYIGYTAAHIPLGILMDRIGSRKVIPVCMALTVLGVIPMLFGSWHMVQIGRVLTGFGSAAAALATFKVSNMYFGKKFAVMTSIATIIGYLGAMYGGAPVALFVENHGWNVFLLALIAVGLVLAILSAFVIYDTEDFISRGSFKEMAKSVFCNKKLLLISLLGGFLIGPLEGFADGWATAFLAEVCRINAEQAVLLPSTIFVGSCIGSLILSCLLSRSYDGYKMIIYCGVFTVFSFVMMLMGRCGTVSSSFVLLLVIGFCSAYQLVTLCKAIEYVGPSAVALATAVSNMIIMLFGYFFHTIIASIVNSHWDGVIIDGHAEYGVDVLIKALAVVPLGALVGTVGFCIFRTLERKKAN